MRSLVRAWLLAALSLAIVPIAAMSSANAQERAPPAAATDGAPNVAAPIPAPEPVPVPVEPGAFPPSLAARGQSGYILGPGDRLRISVFGEPDLSGEFAVDGTGSFALPLIGQTPVQGLTVSQFEELMETRLKERRILNNPNVTAEILNFRPFYILGEVGRPGTYPYTSGLDVFSAVATAGGFAPMANQLRVLIKRAGSSEETAYSLKEPVEVLPGDTIRVIKGSIYILGEVNSPGEYAYSNGMTIMSAVATAGGFTYRANQKRVYIRHENEAGENRYSVAPWLQVQPGDTIRVPERLF